MDNALRHIDRLVFCSETTWLDEQDIQSGTDRSTKKLDELNNYSSTRWDCVLQYLVNPDRGQVTKDTLEVFLNAKLMKQSEPSTSSGQQNTITGAGFQFLLMNRRSQVWFFIIHLLETRQLRGEDISEHLIFLFQLSFATFGKDYSCENFSSVKENFLQHLRELGLIWRKTGLTLGYVNALFKSEDVHEKGNYRPIAPLPALSELPKFLLGIVLAIIAVIIIEEFYYSLKVTRYFPTKLAIELASGLNQGTNDQTNDDIQAGFLFVETNYRIYAYTNNDLYLKIIELFCKMLYRFPNMSVGIVTRQSIRKALSNEISAELILNFLKSHAHPQMRSRLMEQKPLIPTTVSDQIRLWEMERDRIQDQEGMLYNQFLTQNDFELVEKYAKDLGVLLWSSPPKRYVIVSKAGHDEVRRFWKQQRPKSGGGDVK
ncbi:unnamed protein product [Didymodactylos carnosus]|uniref:General transcription factor IIH subunit 4 n=1 Tax=Didymodactylos carnosus TaxID=1234261 RepID=A0A813UY31_9BILA|nr:unnamed protein product [Didymodactylos carnosus]CAF3624020.1 unnamed protein product [Didymodactylos carnosus]